MKKYCIAGFVIIALILLIKLDFLGDVKGAQYHICESKLFSEEEIEDAMNTVKKYFLLTHGGYQLESLEYDELNCYEEIVDVKSWKKLYEPGYSITAVIILYADIRVKNEKLLKRKRNVDYEEGMLIEDIDFVLFQNESNHWVVYNPKR